MADQTEMTRRRRLAGGRCPTHGVGLVQVDVARDDDGVAVGDVVACPRDDCDFRADVLPGSHLWDAVRDGQSACGPDFSEFARALRAEIEWSATLHRDDDTGQAASDRRSLARLEQHVVRVGRKLGFV